MRALPFTVLILFCPLFFLAQPDPPLKPGFQKEELLKMLRLSAYQMDTPWTKTEVPLPENVKLVHRSPIVALENRFDIWLDKKAGYAVINTRGTAGNRPSWLENFYAAMVPAKGSIQLSDSVTFEYKLANNPRAAVHVGWLVGMGSMAPDVVKQILKLHTQGIRSFYLTGHSQGGALTFLLTAYLYHLQKEGKLPADIRFKTYCTAGPKPGNLYFSYDYEYLTRGGWAYNVTSSIDWVPETPFSIQTVKDFNVLNPFSDPSEAFKQLPIPVRWIVKSVYHQLKKHPEKAVKKFQKNLGHRAAQIIIKQDLPQFVEPEYYDSNHYMRCGNQVVLMPTEEYYSVNPTDPDNIFSHHQPLTYLYLVERMEGYE